MNDIVGYRFDPTDKEIIEHYLRLKMLGDVYRVRAINEVDVCKYEPWQLCELSVIKSDSMWHFFCRRDFKYASGERVNRTTNDGYWKKTGTDKKIKKGIAKQVIGTKKHLVFHIGRSPKGTRTEWVMHEYHSTFVPPDKRSFVLCRLVKKEGEENGGTPDVEHEPSSHAPSGNRNCVVDNTVSAPEVTGNTSQQTLIKENRNCVVDNTVSAPEVTGNTSQQTLVTENRNRVVNNSVSSPEAVMNAFQRTLFTEHGNFVVQNTVSSPEGNDWMAEYLNYLAFVPLERAHEFQVQETPADDILGKNLLANNIEGALFDSGVFNEGGDDINLFHVDDINHGEIEILVEPFGMGNDTIFDHITNPFGAMSGDGSSIYQRPLGSMSDVFGSIGVISSEDDSVEALSMCESFDGSQDSPKSLSVAAASPATKKSVPKELKSSHDVNVLPLVENSNDSQHSARSGFGSAASQAAKRSVLMQQKSLPEINVLSLVESSDDSNHSTISLFLPAASKTRKKKSLRYLKVPLQNSSDDSQDSPESHSVAASSQTTKKGVKMRGKSLGRGSPATKKGVNHSGDSPRSFSVAAASQAKKNLHMQQKSSPKDTKNKSRTASRAKKSVYWQRESSLRTRSEDTTEGSSSSDTMISLLRELKGMKLV